ncbi:hypothetical protein J7T55_007878 [Diaporthe amygdali]|uniref:uncharacterized protein n=1 Tax=Phomopsis amygdali TaxID=1214568 RepID=UPI0022FF03E0|nr:uncharacterized protein J7T55_007878 [Diaporthe amygdali]KAJ0114044.1 hypothetical protein J7T55_007878 [Diaporthe amygdali]
MESFDLAPEGLRELMREDHEIQMFENFKATSADALHPGFRHKALLDDQRAEFRPLPSKFVLISLGTRTAANQFPSLLNLKLSEALRDTSLIADLKYKPQGCGWEDVLNCIAAVKASYDDKGKNNKAWKQRIKNKDEILQQLDDLPLLLSEATEKWKLYPHDKRLQGAVENLCGTVVDSMTILIEVLLRTQRGSFISKNMRRAPAVESQRIDHATNMIAEAKKVLKIYIDRLENEALARINDASTSTSSEVKAIRQAIHRHYGIMMRAIGDIATQQRLGYTTDPAARSPLYLFAAEKLCITKNELAKHLRVSEIYSVNEDVERVHRQATNVTTEGLEQARKILSTAEVTDWLSKDESKLILVDGHCKNHGYGKTSPLSVFCASSASALDESPSLVILKYFCSHHSSNSENLPAGPLGLIKSLLGQLLHKSDDVLPLDLHLDNELLDRADPDDVPDLCEVFASIFSQINPAKITICILDEIAEFEGERDGWGESMRFIAYQLRWMVHNFEGPQMIKVLMTSANKSAVVSNILEQNDKISVRAGLGFLITRLDDWR